MQRDESVDMQSSAEQAPEEETGGPAGAGAAGQIEGQHLLRRWADREEVHALPEILRPSEGLVVVGSGTVVKSGRLAQSKWLVTLTDRRLLCIKGRDAASRKVIDMPAAQIRGVETSGLLRKTLSLDTGYGTLRIGGLEKDVAARMAEGITALMGAYEAGEPAAAAAIRATAPSEEPAEGSAVEGDLASAETARAGALPASEELEELRTAISQLESTVGELTERVAFVEELVRSNVAGAGETEVGT